MCLSNIGRVLSVDSPRSVPVRVSPSKCESRQPQLGSSVVWVVTQSYQIIHIRAIMLLIICFNINLHVFIITIFFRYV